MVPALLNAITGVKCYFEKWFELTNILNAFETHKSIWVYTLITAKKKPIHSLL
jgi:hypothetical protein